MFIGGTFALAGFIIRGVVMDVLRRKVARRLDEALSAGLCRARP